MLVLFTWTVAVPYPLAFWTALVVVLAKLLK